MKFIKRKNIDTYKPKSQRFTVEVDGRTTINTDKSLKLPIGDNAARPSGVPGMIRYNNQINDFEVYSAYASGSWGWERLRTDRPSDITIAFLGDGDGDSTVDSVDVVDGGSGYSDVSPPLITFSAPDVGIDTATGDVVVVDGIIQSVTMTNFGSGYLEVPTITIVGANQTASLTALLTGTLDYLLPYYPVNSLGVISSTNIQVYVENVFQLPTINYTVIDFEEDAYVRFDAPVPEGKPIRVIYGFDR